MKRIAVITGASAGLGAEFAVQYARRAAEQNSCDELWLIARRRTGLERVKAEIRGTIGGAVLTVRTIELDITGKAGVAYFEQLLSEEKNSQNLQVVMLINNAGFGIYGTFRESNTISQLNMIEVNCTALTGFCATALPFINRGGCIINAASMAAFLPVGKFAVYAATKAYVLNFSLALRNELKKDGITVIALCPGQVDTEFAKRAVNNTHAVMFGAKNPKKIVAHCLSCAEKNKAVAIWGLSWKIQAFFSRFIGRNFFGWLSFNHITRITIRDKKD